MLKCIEGKLIIKHKKILSDFNRSQQNFYVSILYFHTANQASIHVIPTIAHVCWSLVILWYMSVINIRQALQVLSKVYTSYISRHKMVMGETVLNLS